MSEIVGANDCPSDDIESLRLECRERARRQQQLALENIELRHRLELVEAEARHIDLVLQQERQRAEVAERLAEENLVALGNALGECKELARQMAAMERERDEALRLLYEHTGGPNLSTLVPAVKLVINNAQKTTQECIKLVVSRNAAEAREAELRAQVERLTHQLRKEATERLRPRGFAEDYEN